VGRHRIDRPRLTKGVATYERKNREPEVFKMRGDSKRNIPEEVPENRGHEGKGRKRRGRIQNLNGVG